MGDRDKKPWDNHADRLVRELERLEARIPMGWDRNLSLQIDRIHVELDEFGYSDTDDKFLGAEDS